MQPERKMEEERQTRKLSSKNNAMETNERKFLINTVAYKQDIHDFYLHTMCNNSYNHTQYIYSVTDKEI